MSIALEKPVDPRLEAQEFMASARRRQQRSQRTMSGRLPTKAQLQETFHKLACEASQAHEFNIKGASAHVQTMLERFEKLCHRNKLSIPARLRSFIAAELLGELNENLTAFEMENMAHKALSMTVYQGTGFIAALRDEAYSFFDGQMGAFRQAVHQNPLNPEGYLRRAIDTIQRISNDPEFKSFWNTPNIIKYAALSAKDPEEFLRDVEHMIEELMENPANRFFKSQSAMVKEIVVRYSNPQARLDKIKKTVADLRTDPAFEELRESEWVFLYAAQRKNARGFLETVLSKKAEILNNPEFALFHDTPSYVVQVLTHTPDKAEENLRHAINTYEELRVLDKYKMFADTPWVIKQAAINYPTQTQTYLDDVITEYQRICAEPEFANIRHLNSRILEAIIQYEDADAFLRNHIQTVGNGKYAATPPIASAE